MAERTKPEHLSPPNILDSLSRLTNLVNNHQIKPPQLMSELTSTLRQTLNSPTMIISLNGNTEHEIPIIAGSGISPKTKASGLQLGMPEEIGQQIQITSYTGKGKPVERVGIALPFAVTNHYHMLAIFPKKPLNQEQLTYVNFAASLVRHRIEKDYQENRAVTDSLTNLINKEGYYRIGQKLVSEAHRKGIPLTAFMLDLRGFKAFNELYGHLTGDLALRKLASTLSSSFRDYDLVTRFGGDEFVILLQDTNLEQSKLIVQRLLNNVDKIGLELDGQILKMLISVGIAQLKPTQNTLDGFIADADHAYYVAKRLNPGMSTACYKGSDGKIYDLNGKEITV